MTAQTEPVESREVIIEGTPRSLQGSADGVRAWKTSIVETAHKALGEDQESIQFRDVFACILHFCPSWDEGAADVDNIAKPILDALVASHRVLFDDSQVAQLFIRRIAWEQPRAGRVEIPRASPALAERLSAALENTNRGDFVYVLITTDFSLEGLS